MCSGLVGRAAWSAAERPLCLQLQFVTGSLALLARSVTFVERWLLRRRIPRRGQFLLKRWSGLDWLWGWLLVLPLAGQVILVALGLRPLPQLTMQQRGPKVRNQLFSSVLPLVGVE